MSDNTLFFQFRKHREQFITMTSTAVESSPQNIGQQAPLEIKEEKFNTGQGEYEAGQKAHASQSLYCLSFFFFPSSFSSHSLCVRFRVQSQLCALYQGCRGWSRARPVRSH